MIKDNSRTDGNVLIINLMDVREIVSGNRFKEYVLFPEQNVSVRIIWGRMQQNVVLTVGYSIFNQTCKVDIGSLMLKFGGGGHQAVGTCQVPADGWEDRLAEIVAALKAG